MDLSIHSETSEASGSGGAESSGTEALASGYDAMAASQMNRVHGHEDWA